MSQGEGRGLFDLKWGRKGGRPASPLLKHAVELSCAVWGVFGTAVGVAAGWPILAAKGDIVLLLVIALVVFVLALIAVNIILLFMLSSQSLWISKTIMRANNARRRRASLEHHTEIADDYLKQEAREERKFLNQAAAASLFSRGSDPEQGIASVRAALKSYLNESIELAIKTVAARKGAKSSDFSGHIVAIKEVQGVLRYSTIARSREGHDSRSAQEYGDDMMLGLPCLSEHQVYSALAHPNMRKVCVADDLEDLLDHDGAWEPERFAFPCRNDLDSYRYFITTAIRTELALGLDVGTMPATERVASSGRSYCVGFISIDSRMHSFDLQKDANILEELSIRVTNILTAANAFIDILNANSARITQYGRQEGTIYSQQAGE